MVRGAKRWYQRWYEELLVVNGGMRSLPQKKNRIFLAVSSATDSPGKVCFGYAGRTETKNEDPTINHSTRKRKEKSTRQ